MAVFTNVSSLSPILIQDRNSLLSGGSKNYDSSSFPDVLDNGLQKKTVKIQAIGTADIDVVFLDEDDNDLNQSLNLQGGESYEYNFANKHTYPYGIRVEANADSDYLLIVERS